MCHRSSDFGVGVAYQSSGWHKFWDFVGQSVVICLYLCGNFYRKIFFKTSITIYDEEIYVDNAGLHVCDVWMG